MYFAKVPSTYLIDLAWHVRERVLKGHFFPDCPKCESRNSTRLVDPYLPCASLESRNAQLVETPVVYSIIQYYMYCYINIV